MNARFELFKATIRDAWHTLAMLPDPDARFRRMFGCSWVLPVVRDPNTEYGSTPASWLGTPTAHEISVMEDVFDWLSWLRQQKPISKYDFEIVGEHAIKRIAAWGRRQPIWQIAQRERCSERTIHNRIDQSVAKIMMKFRCEHVEIEEINEPEETQARIRGFTAPHEPDQSGSVAEPGKVFIAGVGMMYRGEKYRSSYD